MQQYYWLMNMHVWNSFLKKEIIVWMSTPGSPELNSGGSVISFAAVSAVFGVK